MIDRKFVIWTIGVITGGLVVLLDANPLLALSLGFLSYGVVIAISEN